MLEEMTTCANRGESFAFETTLAGKSYLHRFKQWQAAGYRIVLFFLALPNADTAVARVALRVSQGGHHVPEAVVRRRFAAGLRNFETIYRDIADEWAVYDNSGSVPELIQWGERK
jgi:predicted ABC-type ATPase